MWCAFFLFFFNAAWFRGYYLWQCFNEWDHTFGLEQCCLRRPHATPSQFPRRMSEPKSLNEPIEQIDMAIGVRHGAPVPNSGVSTGCRALEPILQWRCGQINTSKPKRGMMVHVLPAWSYKWQQSAEIILLLPLLKQNKNKIWSSCKRSKNSALILRCQRRNWRRVWSVKAHG